LPQTAPTGVEWPALKNTDFGRRNLVKSNEVMFGDLGLAATDHELSDRLYELQYYAQILFNYVRTASEQVAVRERKAPGSRVNLSAWDLLAGPECDRDQ
jgi:hypothetical protein